MAPYEQYHQIGVDQLTSLKCSYHVGQVLQIWRTDRGGRRNGND